MKIPALKGIIRRRILLNYRIAPEVVESILPKNFRPKLFRGYAIAGICLIRLEHIRPRGLPGFVGISSENSAHRIAVKWESARGLQEGVYVPRRDTDSRLNSLAGGRLFPGVHHHSQFSVVDRDGQITLRIVAEDLKEPLAEIEVSESTIFPGNSVFNSLPESSEFFEAGCIGYSSRPQSGRLDGLLLKVSDWRVSPLAVQHVRSAYFDDSSLFPPNSIQFDHALLMRNIAHEWHSEPEMSTEPQPANKRLLTNPCP